MATGGTDTTGVAGTTSATRRSTFGGRSGCPAPCVAAIAVVVLGLVAALAAAQWTQVRNGRVAADRFQVVATRVASLVEGRMARYEYALRGARGAVAATGEAGITRDGFHRYASTRDIGREFPGARGFGFVRRVPAADEAPFPLLAMIDNCVSIVRGPADAKGLEFRLRMDPALPRWMRLSIETPASRIAAAISARTPTRSATVKRR